MAGFFNKLKGTGAVSFPPLSILRITPWAFAHPTHPLSQYASMWLR